MNVTGKDSPRTMYEVAVIGGGFAGSLLAAVLARNGVRTLLVEGEQPPRFAVGESMVPYTAALARVVARRYGVPEVEHLTSLKAVQREVSSRCGVMRNMGFVHHRAHLRQHPGEIYQVVNPSVVPPVPHLFREDIDAHLLGVARRYGADVRTGPGARVDGLRIDAGTGVTLRSAGGEEFTAQYVVDAGGHDALLPRELALREKPTRARHHSRTLFTHMTGVMPYDETPAGRLHDRPSPWHQGTLHHVFDGGWLWVIPFDNQPRSTNSLCSVGLTLDPRKHPAGGPPPQREFDEVLAQFPDLARQFAHAEPARPWTATGRLQYSSQRVVGDRYCLASHAAGFVDPLYSRGLAHSLEVVNALGRRLIDAAREGDWCTERFQYVEDLQQALFDTHDDLAYASFVSFRDFELFNAVVRTWTVSTVLGALAVENACAAYGRSGDDSVFRDLEQTRHPGSPFPTSAHYNALGPLTRTLCEEVEAGTRTPKSAADRIFDAIREADYLPPSLGLGDPADRFFHNTPARIVRAARWVRTDAPDEVGALLKGAMGGLIRERLRGVRRPG
ncbi:halogenase [Streptomyces albiflavescens]|uniref:Halogenase n=1 Tax=Streptomyces albiflavescens TaxID=1623582 RepID=A0A917YEQ5_9ACTN|nr:tryptophan 7-halogenase [Streptomyces albiflavescens]GGN94732.1 halogenase [Streptomyces albiflavescens]